MISPLLDPNQIPIVRAPERRGAEASPRSFEQVLTPPASDQSDDALAVELEMQDTHGALRRVSLPWGLAANGRLSQQGVGVVADTQLFLRMQPAVDPAMAACAPFARGIVPAAYTTPTTSASVDLSSPVPIFLPRSEVADPPPASSLSPEKTHAELGLPWQERWLQWLRGGNGDLQVRLRDYRLNEAEHNQLLEQLHLFARDQGLTLKRLTVNGRELWRTPVAESGEPHGG